MLCTKVDFWRELNTIFKVLYCQTCDWWLISTQKKFYPLRLELINFQRTLIQCLKCLQTSNIYCNFVIQITDFLRFMHWTDYWQFQQSFHVVRNRQLWFTKSISRNIQGSFVIIFSERQPSNCRISCACHTTLQIGEFLDSWMSVFLLTAESRNCAIPRNCLKLT